MIFMGVDLVLLLIDVIVTMYFTVLDFLKAKDGGCYDANKAAFIEMFIIISLNAVLALSMGFSAFTLSV